MSSVSEFLEDLVSGLLAAILPSPHRERIAREHELDPAHWSLVIGMFQAPAGIGLFVIGGLEFLGATTADQGFLLLKNWWPGMSSTHLQGIGLINWFAWFINPASWPFIYLGLTGILRCAVYAISRETVAEPVVCAVMFAWAAASDRIRTGVRERELGPPRPDTMHERADGGLIICTCREKPEWNEDVTIRYGERFFRLDSRSEHAEAGKRVIIYNLRQEKPNAVIRRLSIYEP